MVNFSKTDIYVITGASSGLGEATAIQLANSGAIIIAVARNIEKLQELKKSIENSENFYIEEFDFYDTAKIVPFFKKLAKEYGKLTGIAHFAGISKLLPIRATSVDVIEETFKLNLFSSFEIVKAFNDKRVRNEGSSILLISSISAIRSFEGLSAYASSKGAINSLVISSATELAKSNVRINSILPGHIETNMTKIMGETQSDEYKKEIIDSYPLGQGLPEDVANLSAFLLSSKSRWITGQNITIDGGRTLI